MAGIVNGLFAGRSGIAAHGNAISVLSDNIANANTTGFKASRADFSDLIAGSLGGGGAADSGSGSTTQSITPVFSQGTLESTGRGLDLAIEGNGFFIVSDNGARFYSRAGNFQIDSDGTLLNQNGFEVLGFPASGAGGLTSLNVNTVSQSAVPSSRVTITGNVDASADVLSGAIPSGAGTTFSDLNDAAAFSTFVDVNDSLGETHSVTIYFFRTSATDWTVNAYVDAGEVGGTAGEPSLVGGPGVITFNADGSRDPASTAGGEDFTLTAAWDNGASTADIDFFFTPFTQFASASNISSITQNGKGTGSVTSFNVEKDGTLLALLSNGQTSAIGTIALASFSNAEGLRRVGNSLYTSSLNSGAPVIGSPGAGSFGETKSGTLELSTSDIAGDFIKLISLQRGFQGSSRVITAIDRLLDEIVNLAR